jgi:ElaB/YqjD/DUF883 family membrane-anchored ribosome-binding protein
MKHALVGNGHPASVHSEFEVSPRSAANLFQKFRYRIQNNRTVRRARDSVAHYVHDHSPKNMAAGVERLIRQRPATALVIAAAAGFLIGRTVRRR